MVIRAGDVFRSVASPRAFRSPPTSGILPSQPGALAVAPHQ
jgi:hypothetical protein